MFIYKEREREGERDENDCKQKLTLHTELEAWKITPWRGHIAQGVYEEMVAVRIGHCST